MAIIDITPVMTNFNSPPPYVTSSNSDYGGVNNRVSWHSFNYTSDSIWMTKNGEHENSWIMIDFGEVIKFSMISLKNVDFTYCTVQDCMPRVFNIEGSNDGENFDILKEIDQDINNKWPIDQTREFNLNKGYECRYLRLVIKSPYDKNSQGYDFAIVGKVKIYYDDEMDQDMEIIEIDADSTFKNRCLPMSTTNKIKSITKDKREGLFGMASDDLNYGDLYVIGKNEKANLTISGKCKVEIFNGNVKDGDITLNRNIMDFQLLSINVIENSDSSEYMTCEVIITDNLIKDKKKILISWYNSLSMWISIIDDYTLKITHNHNSGMSIKEIYGHL